MKTAFSSGNPRFRLFDGATGCGFQPGATPCKLTISAPIEVCIADAVCAPPAPSPRDSGGRITLAPECL